MMVVYTSKAKSSQVSDLFYDLADRNRGTKTRQSVKLSLTDGPLIITVK
jgi:hypothetical protein